MAGGRVSNRRIERNGACAASQKEIRPARSALRSIIRLTTGVGIAEAIAHQGVPRWLTASKASAGWRDIWIAAVTPKEASQMIARVVMIRRIPVGPCAEELQRDEIVWPCRRCR